jgi:ATP/maltotriose-dependent transcriptional regulator MalT
MLATLRGDIRDALDNMRATIPLASQSIDPMIRSSALNTYAATLVLSGEYAKAKETAQQELKLAKKYKLNFAVPHAELCRAAALWGLRRFRECIALLAAVRRVLDGDGFLLMNVGAVLARVYLALGSSDRALNALETHQHLVTTRGMEAEFEAWWALALASSGDFDESLAKASSAAATSRRTEVVGLVPWVTAVVDVLTAAANREASIRQAFSTSCQTGNLDSFVAAYRNCPEILSVLIEEKGSHRRLRAVLANANDHSLGRKVGLKLPGSMALPRSTLSRREQDVLDLLVQGATNREIAKALFLSEATVKVHLRRIYAKLGVRSRTEAVLRALERED